VILCDNATGEWATRADPVGKRDLAVNASKCPREDVPDFTCAAC
jgi:16S rRNA (uracil1498-N3)-methyltransferase